jgi:hypothetical protein
MFYISRLYVPLSLFILYKKGTFSDAFSTSELKHIIKIGLSMYFLELSGHGMMRYYSKPVV